MVIITEDFMDETRVLIHILVAVYDVHLSSWVETILSPLCRILKLFLSTRPEEKDIIDVSQVKERL